MSASELRSVVGNISSFQSFGSVDGPGIRYVVFLQGCPLRCSCCHNPETWPLNAGSEMTAGEVFDRILRYKSYFGKNGGVTVSGGEPLLQTEFLIALFSLCRQAGIHTCLDTSGCIVDDRTEELLSVTNLVLLDIKYASEEKYRQYVGCTLKKPIEFLNFLEKNAIDTWIRQVVIRGINDSDGDLCRLKKLLANRSNIKKIEFLAFRLLCREKYENLGIEFPFGHIGDTSPKEIEAMYTRFDAINADIACDQ